MKIIALLLLCFSSICTIAQPLQVEWVKSIPGSLYEQNSSIAQAPCGDLYVVGYFQEFFGALSTLNGENGFVSKYNDQGVLLWTKQLIVTNDNHLNGIAVGEDNQIYIVGDFKGVFYYNNDSLVSQNELDVLVTQIDSSGIIQWAKSGGGLGFEEGADISVSANGNLCVTGYYESTLTFDTTTIQGFGLRDVFVANFDQFGNLQWLESFGGPAFETSRSITTDNSDNIYITGSFRDFLFLANDTIAGYGLYDAFVTKYNNLGQLQWVKVLGGSKIDEGAYISIDENQNVYAVGWFERSINIDTFLLSGNREQDGYLVKLDPNGNLLWAESLGGEFGDRALAVDCDLDNNVYVMGSLDSIFILGGDSLLNKHLSRSLNIFLAKYDEHGDYQWAQSLGYHNHDFCFDLLVNDEASLYIAGSFFDSTIFVTDTFVSQNDYDVFLCKLNLDTTVAIPQLPNQEKQALLDLQFFPNPCSSESTLSYTLSQPSTVKITLYDLLGRERRSILDEHQSTGNHQISIHKQKKEKGLYFLLLETEESSFLLKVTFN